MLSTMPMSNRRHSDMLVALVVITLVLWLASILPPPPLHQYDNDSDDWSVGTGPRSSAASSRARRNYTYTHDNKNDFDPNMTEYYFDTPLDHYNFRPTTPSKFKLRYFVNDQYYCYDDHYCDDESSPSPVILYAGNEAPIEQFIKNGGFLWEAAKELRALIVFCEHRYYGKSFPLGADDPSKSLTPDMISYLTVEQAMQDFNLLQQHLRNTPTYRMNSATAFVVTGGSYGGNLALWLRLHNPNVWAGALASSATPLKHLLRDSNAFNKIVTEAYGNVSAKCPDLVRQGWKELQEYSTSSDGRAILKQELNLCHVSSDSPENIVDAVHGWISGALETMVQYGYPYPTNFYNPVPGFPFAVSCHNMIQAAAGSVRDQNQEATTTAPSTRAKFAGLKALRAAAQVYYNYTGQAGPCFDWLGRGADAGDGEARTRPSKSNHQYWNRMGQMDRVSPLNDSTAQEDDWVGVAWGYQCCTEVYQPMPTNGVTDFELPYTPNQTQYFQNCQRRWDGVTPRPNWEEMTFWSDKIQAGSNIFLSSGQLDPWRAAGIQRLDKARDNSIIIRIIEQGAHHYDLRGSHPLDPPSVVKVRQEELQAMKGWIQEWRQLYPSSSSTASSLASSPSSSSSSNE